MEELAVAPFALTATRGKCSK
ncbi:hypothetical protein A2U01_0038399, partial [Trifolium medium]|nr:hypothetical protein [Trifolium medium]